MPTGRTWGVVVAVTIAAGGLAVSAQTAAADHDSPVYTRHRGLIGSREPATVTLYRDAAAAGSRVSGMATHFEPLPPARPVQIRLGGDDGPVVADRLLPRPDGTVPFSFRVPAGTAPGNYQVVVSQWCLGGGDYYIEPAPVPGTPARTMLRVLPAGGGPIPGPAGDGDAAAEAGAVRERAGRRAEALGQRSGERPANEAAGKTAASRLSASRPATPSPSSPGPFGVSLTPADTVSPPAAGPALGRSADAASSRAPALPGGRVGGSTQAAPVAPERTLDRNRPPSARTTGAANGDGPAVGAIVALVTLLATGVLLVRRHRRGEPPTPATADPAVSPEGCPKAAEPGDGTLDAELAAMLAQTDERQPVGHR